MAFSTLKTIVSQFKFKSNQLNSRVSKRTQNNFKTTFNAFYLMNLNFTDYDFQDYDHDHFIFIQD